jgi:hypothetical protein
MGILCTHHHHKESPVSYIERHTITLTDDELRLVRSLIEWKVDNLNDQVKEDLYFNRAPYPGTLSRLQDLTILSETLTQQVKR